MIREVAPAPCSNGTKLTQTMRFATTEERDTTMQYGVEEGAKGGFARVDAVLQRLTHTQLANRLRG